jgi:hypothetical protein
MKNEDPCGNSKIQDEIASKPIFIGAKKNKNGQAFMIAFLVFCVLSVFAMSLSELWYNSISIKAMTKNGIWAFYAAQAGLEQGKIYADAIGETPGNGANWLPCNSSNATVINTSACWYKDIPGDLSRGVPGQWYQFRVDNVTGVWNVSANGRAMGPNNTTFAERRMRVVVNLSAAPQVKAFSWEEQ